MGMFDDKVCLIAGGARGIGASTAEAFVREGGRVVIGDTRPEEMAELVERLGPEAATGFLLDVRDPASCAAFVAHAVATFGAADHLVNCAIRMAPGPLLDLDADDFRALLEVGLTGTFLTAQAVARWLVANERTGSIVNLSSIGGRFPYSGTGAYSTVKGGTILLTQQMAMEWADKGIRVNVVAPGHIETPLTAYLQDPEVKRARSEATPLGRVGQPEDIAEGILYLLSDRASYVTATVLDIDGGVGASIMNHLKGRRWDR